MPFDGAFSPLHRLVIAAVALLVLGPDALPDAARKAGAAWRELHGMYRALLDDACGVLAPPDPHVDEHVDSASLPAGVV